MSNKDRPDARHGRPRVAHPAVAEPGMNVTVVRRVDDPDVQLVSASGESCGLTGSVRVGTVPCPFLNASGGYTTA
jgi:hypothetical protein